MKKIIIWALFDDGIGSWNHLEYDKEKYIIYSIGINDNKDWNNYYKIDLSLTNSNLIKELKKLPKPDIIVASPPCESWSWADGVGQIHNEINGNNWNIKNKFYYDTKKRNFFNKERQRILGYDTASATIYILETFEPKIWVIENPKSSMIWKFYKYHHCFYGIENDTYYSSYDTDFSAKPTRFLSNINLYLIKEKAKTLNSLNPRYKKRNPAIEKVILDYNNRSSIPKQLLLKILEQLERVENGE